MLNKNSLATGIFAGLVFPAIAGVCAYLFKYSELIINRPGLPYLIAVALNLFVLRYFMKKGDDKTGRGVMLITFICLLLVFVLKIQRFK